MKTNYHLRLPAMGAAALLAAALLCASASAATVAKFIEYVQTDGNGSNNGEYVLLDYKPTANSIVEADIYLSNVTQTHGIFCARERDGRANVYALPRRKPRIALGL